MLSTKLRKYTEPFFCCLQVKVKGYFLAMQSYGLQVLLVAMSVAFHGLSWNFGKFGSRRFFVLASVNSKPRH